jgi:hypothetical protein
MSPFYYSPDIISNKQTSSTAFWSRPTIQWKLSCEAIQTRQGAYDLVMEQSKHNDDPGNAFAKSVRNSSMWGFLIITIPCLFCTCIFGVMSMKDNEKFMLVLIPILCNLIAQIICASFIIAKAQKAVDAFGVKSDNVQAYSHFGDCSSKYMQMSTTVSADIKLAVDYMN